MTRRSCIGAVRGSGRSIGVLSEVQLRAQQRETAAQAADRHYANCSHMSADAVFEYLVASQPYLLWVTGR